MRIDRIRVDGFGRLRGWDTGPEPLASLVVVVGPNEAGKSTLFTFLTTALYGFQPATRERNPHVPWGADEAAGRIHLRLGTGACVEVERRLRSQPAGCLVAGGRTRELRNQPLPWVEHVPRAVFRQVFAITLTELSRLDGETWARIQDKVVGSMGAADLRSARQVAEELEREAGEIWRPNRRGNQRLRDLQAEQRALRARRAEAYERDQRVRALVEERQATLARLAEARAARERERVAADRAQSLLFVRRQLARIVALREEAGRPEELDGLPADPPAVWARLEADRRSLAARRAALEARLEELARTASAFDARAAALLARSDDVTRLRARAAAAALDGARARELEGELARVGARLDAVGAELLERPWREVPADTLLALPLEALRERVAAAAAATAAAKAARAEAPAGPPAAVLLAALGGGAALLAWGVGSASPAAAAAGAAVAGVSATAWLLRRARATAARREAEAGGGGPDLAALLDGVPLRRAQLERPGPALVSGLSRLRELVAEREGYVRAREAAAARVAEVEAEARALAGELLGAAAAGDAQALAAELDRALLAAERARQAAALAERETERLEAEREELRPALERLEAERGRLARAAGALAAGDVERGLEVARARLEARRKAEQLRDELERAHGSLNALTPLGEKGQPDGAGGAGDAPSDDEIAAARARLAAHEEEIERLLQRAEALERDAEHLRELETVDAVDSEAESLRELEARLVRERDRKWVLAQLLREADRRFREEHQPDLVRRAGAYLERLTGGRYERLVVDETGQDHLFRLVGPGLPAPMALAPPVSTGTLEQAYLSLRLAIVDHLDQGGERLPLFVDEVFVNWDRERQARGLEVLAEVAASRQVFVFTCNADVADRLARGGAHILRMERT